MEMDTDLKKARGDCKPSTRLAILTTHPIQYYAPVFRSLTDSGRLVVKAFYGWEGLIRGGVDPGFGQEVKWDIPLLEGYPFEFLKNRSKRPGSSRFGGIDCPDAKSKISDWNPDAVLVYGWSYKTHLRVMRSFHHRVPVLFRGDSTLLDEQQGLKTFLRRRLLRWVYRHVDKAIYVGSNNREYFRVHGLQDEQLFFAPHAIDNARFQWNVTSQITAAKQLRADLGIGDEQQFWLFVGKLEPKKSPDLLLRAFRELGGANVHLGFVGTGELEQELRINAGANVHFLGFRNQTEMPALYRAANLMILPSRGPGETWGLAINEAMACCLPIVASDRVGSALDLVRPGENGWIFHAGRLDSLSSVLREAISKSHLELAHMGQKSLEIISTWSIENQVRGIEEAVLGPCGT